MGQVAQTAMMGVNGLLGMSSNTGYTDPAFTGSYLDQQVSGQQTLGDSTMSKYLTTIDAQLATENSYLTLINSAVPLLEKLNTTDSIAERDRALLEKIKVETNIAALTKIKTDLLTGLRPINELIAEYSQLVLHTDSQVKSDQEKWLGMFTSLYSESLALVNSAIADIKTFLPLLTRIHSVEANNQISLINGTYSPDLALQLAELNKIADEWNNPSIPKVDTLQHYIDLRNGAIVGVPALFSPQDYNDVITLWQNIVGL
jgi:hypothetical protein